MGMNQEKAVSAIVITWIVTIVLGVIGWVANIVQLVGMASVFTGLGVVKIIGIFALPIGAILGLVGLF